MLSLFACRDLQLNIASAVHLVVIFWKFLIGAVDDNVKVFPAKWWFAFLDEQYCESRIKPDKIVKDWKAKTYRSSKFRWQSWCFQRKNMSGTWQRLALKNACCQMQFGLLTVHK
jgi:hypothetical protein